MRPVQKDSNQEFLENKQVNQLAETPGRQLTDIWAQKRIPRSKALKVLNSVSKFLLVICSNALILP